MNIENHILWKITTTYGLLYKLRKKFKDGDLSWEEYAALMEPKCIEVMKEILVCLESGDFLERHRKNMFIEDPKPGEPAIPSRDKNGHPSQSTSEWAIKRYNQFVEVYHNAMSQTDPEKKLKELIIGFDSFVGWMHGSFELSQWVVKQRPITGDSGVDYNIALDLMTLVTYSHNIDGGILYLRVCDVSNQRAKIDWRKLRDNSGPWLEAEVL
jgi:hypothetical protein